MVNLIANQDIHSEYGGVVPELASREHQKNIIPTVRAALIKANMNLTELDAIAYTQGPGLMGSLLVGGSFAKGLAVALNKPLLAVNHMQAHILAHFIENNEYSTPPQFPLLCLTVSGGHTQIVLVKDHLSMEVVGETLDDAAGEAYDKIAKIIGLPYPGGPEIDKLAKLGNPKAFDFSRGNVPDFNFSFSGLKTSILYFLQKEMKKDNGFIENNLEDICASVQFNIVETLISKFLKAAKRYQVNDLAIAGGVSANSYLRQRLLEIGENKKYNVFIPKFEYCTDNAAMIGIVGYFKYLNNDFSSLSDLPLARMKL